MGIYLSQNLPSYIPEIHAIYSRSIILQESYFTEDSNQVILTLSDFWNHWTKPEFSAPTPPYTEGCLFGFQFPRKNTSDTL